MLHSSVSVVVIATKGQSSILVFIFMLPGIIYEVSGDRKPTHCIPMIPRVQDVPQIIINNNTTMIIIKIIYYDSQSIIIIL